MEERKTIKISADVNRAAKKHAGFKPDVDPNDNDERYYQTHRCEVYDAFIAGHKYEQKYTRADIIHAFTSGHNKAKMGMTHSDALLQYKEEQKL